MLNIDDLEKLHSQLSRVSSMHCCHGFCSSGVGSIYDAAAVFIMVKLQVAFNRTNPNGYKKVNVGLQVYLRRLTV